MSTDDNSARRYPLRTLDEIAARVHAVKDADFFGFETSTLISYLDFKRAEPWLKENAAEADWKPCVLSEPVLLAEIAGYMTFAWEKAIDSRGLSASRSISRFRAWVWLLGDETLFEEFEEARYEDFGAPKLVVVCRALSLQIPNEAERLLPEEDRLVR